MKPSGNCGCILLALILVVVGGCQGVAYEGQTTSRSPTARVELTVVPLSPTATSEQAATAATGPPKPTPTVEPSEAIAPIQSPSAQGEERDYPVRITIIYDNNPYDPRLRTAWGFGGLIETRDTTILFDTGGDGATLLGNMATLGIEPENIEVVVLSHIHGDHTGGLGSLLGTVIVGLCLGLIDGVGPILFDPAIAVILPFALVIVVLLFRPQGLFGRED